MMGKQAHGRTAVACHLDALLPPLSLSPCGKTLVSGGSTGRRYEKGIAGSMSQRVCRVRVTLRSRPDAVTRQLSDRCTQDRVYARCEILYTFWRLLTCSGKFVCAHSSMQDIHSLQ